MPEYFDELKEVLSGVRDYGRYLSALCPFTMTVVHHFLYTRMPIDARRVEHLGERSICSNG